MQRSDRRKFLKTSSGVAIAACGCFELMAAERDSMKDPAKGDPKTDENQEMLTADAQKAIDRGLEFLAKRQLVNGSFRGKGYSSNVGICALGGMAFLRSGSRPGKGKHGKRVDACIRYVVAHGEKTGLIIARGGQSHGPMYSHALSVWFLADAYRHSKRKVILDTLEPAVELLVDCQNDAGGWRYQPRKSDADISVTACAIIALAAARAAELEVPKKTIDSAVRYIKNCQNGDGGFRYMVKDGASAFPRSAAALSALQAAGVTKGPFVNKALTYLTSLPPTGNARRQGHYFYARLFATRAMRRTGGAWWRKWYPAIRDELLARQNEDGSWRDTIGSEYGTAAACLILSESRSTERGLRSK